MLEHISYVKQQHQNLSLDHQYSALLIMDVFKGQMTKEVKDLLNENNIKLQKVPVNLTYLFQAVDVQGSPNGHAKRFMKKKKKLTLWYADQAKSELDKGKKIKEINISMRLSILKPQHAKWLIDLDNYMTSPDGQAVLLKGWKVAGITEAVQKGLNGLPFLDPFHDINPLSFTPNAEDDTFQNDHDEEDEKQSLMYIHEGEEEETVEEEWVDADGNAFNLFEIDED